MSDLTDTAATIGDHARRPRARRPPRPFATHVIPTAVVSRCHRPPTRSRSPTLLGDYDQAEAWFATAHDIHARLQAPFWTAHGQLDHADLCLARRADGDLERARGTRHAPPPQPPPSTAAPDSRARADALLSVL